MDSHATAFARRWVLLVATGHGTSVSAAGDTLAAAAGPLFERVMALRRWGAA